MVMETRTFPKTFQKLRWVPLKPKGDVELGNHLIKKWCTGASCVSVFSKTDWFKLRPLFQPYMYNHNTPLWDGALLITLVNTSREPALLVAGEYELLSRYGVVPGRVTMAVFTDTGHTVVSPLGWYDLE